MRYKLYLDDSGQLHPNYPHADHFIYGGLLVTESNFHGVNASYKNLVKQIKREKGIEGELKTSSMSLGTRKRLLKKLRTYTCNQVFVTVKVPDLIRIDFEKKKDVVRYKNYILRRLVDKLINQKIIPKSCSCLEVNIDNQNVAHSALDSLEDHLTNFFNEDNYYQIHKNYNTTSFQTDFAVNYKDSETNYLIQAADLLANTKLHMLEHEMDLKRFLKENYTAVRLP
ncbi:DUF3800 domain-containing protein [Pontibacillus salipaludis]|uniref:DUF3800 domain-containing protein n=1 Tax=Pontibacillus salipaludis TaxID=1697394 RepID=A0ABQ1Q3X3_9BACI|nr:DUF3800 domain-containing protein [Pontibacillus salipaludis]GGD12775.1 hypothetical protein GCM10011389_20410 [Pontibacillus salipaludis]